MKPGTIKSLVGTTYTSVNGSIREYMEESIICNCKTFDILAQGKHKLRGKTNNQKSEQLSP